MSHTADCWLCLFTDEEVSSQTTATAGATQQPKARPRWGFIICVCIYCTGWLVCCFVRCYRKAQLMSMSATCSLCVITVVMTVITDSYVIYELFGETDWNIKFIMGTINRNGVTQQTLPVLWALAWVPYPEARMTSLLVNMSFSNGRTIKREPRLSAAQLVMASRLIATVVSQRIWADSLDKCLSALASLRVSVQGLPACQYWHSSRVYYSGSCCC